MQDAHLDGEDWVERRALTLAKWRQAFLSGLACICSRSDNPRTADGQRDGRLRLLGRRKSGTPKGDPSLASFTAARCAEPADAEYAILEVPAYPTGTLAFVRASRIMHLPAPAGWRSVARAARCGTRNPGGFSSSRHTPPATPRRVSPGAPSALTPSAFFC